VGPLLSLSDIIQDITCSMTNIKDGIRSNHVDNVLAATENLETEITRLAEDSPSEIATRELSGSTSLITRAGWA
jgi:hypothetical protein